MTPEIDHQRERAFLWIVCVLGVAIRIWIAWTPLDPDVVLEYAGPDDLMHIISVRDWVSGQGWYDMNQYRVLPPDGADLHWSRYVMLGPAALLYLFDMFMSPQQAELLMAVVWPTFLLGIMILVVGIGSARAFGGYAGAFAVLMMLTAPGAGLGHFAIGQMDHHNSQAVLMALAVAALIWSGVPRKSGFVGAFAIALSLAIGLETLLLAIGIGLAFVIRAALGGHEERERLGSFCVSLVPLAILLHIGQTSPGEWLTPYCDRLSVPIILLAAVGAMSGLVGLLASSRTPVFLAVVCGAAVLGLVASNPVIGPCLEGPYMNLPQELQKFIFNSITEARPLFHYFEQDSASAIAVILPVICAMVLAIWVNDNKKDESRVTVLLILSAIALGACLWQVRQITLLGPVISPLAGLSMAVLYRRLVSDLSRSNILAMALGVVATFLNWLVFEAGNSIISWISNTPDEVAWIPDSSDKDCKLPSSISQLSDLPQGKVLVPLGLGPRVLYSTHHYTLSVGYHRNARAFYNGSIAFELDEDDFGGVLKNESADYLVMCKDVPYLYPNAIGSRIASGYVPEFLEPVPGNYEHLVVLRVLK